MAQRVKAKAILPKRASPGMWTAALLLLAASLAVSGCAEIADRVREQVGRESTSRAGLDRATVAAGLREALAQGTTRAVRELGHENGFWSHPRLRIPIPANLQKAERGLRRLGQAKLADDFALALNRAGERAAPAAREIFLEAIHQMTIQDAFEILRGPSDAATQYFRRHTEARLTRAFRPIVARSTEAVGVTAAYKRVLVRAQPLGLIDTSQWDIDDYVTHKTLDGLFQLVAAEEQRIRADPVARTTELLRNVFR